MLLTGLGLAAGLLLVGWCIAAGLVSPLSETVQTLQRMATGDLTTQLTFDAQDEVGQMATSLNYAMQSLGAALSGEDLTSSTLMPTKM